MSDSDGGGHQPKSKKKVSIEKIYQKKTQLEHILLRPDTYIGSVEPVTENMWVYDTLEQKMVQRGVTFVPGLYKIFDEILVNAADNKQRDKKMDCIKININAEKNEISVWNNGKGIPVEMHKEEKMYVPTMIFGHLLTSSNYNDEEAKVTGGRNGYGAKLCNIFSNKFTVETASKDSKKKFKQTWQDNMSKAGDPKIADSSDDYTKITFAPDLGKFKMVALDKDIIDIMSRRAYDIAASSGGVKVYLNDKRVPVKNFKDYIDLFVKSKDDDIGQPVKVTYEKANERWEVGVALSDAGFQQISFVNSIATTKGGRHVDYVTDMMVKQLAEVIKKKNKGGINVKPFQIKNHMWVFVNCLIVNPTFDSQTKENMTLQAKSFGSKCSLTDKFINAVLKSGITEAVLSWAKFKAQSQLDKVGGKKKSKLKGVAKLEDANEAGTRNAHKCTLILTEGDSAKSLAVSGLGVVGRDHYGVFPLRGKMLNVREASHKQILENAEINAIIKILGLQYKKKYTCVDDLKTLRYGKLMIMTDQDQDGSHIKGLLINFLHHNWPELLRLPFLEEFITPIVKATKKNHSLSFYSVPEFEEWRKNTANAHQYHIKYYKGLGTSTSKEAKEYFEDMQRHRIKFKYSGNQDDNCIIMAFSKKCVDQRKEWLNNWMGECKRRREMDLPDIFLYEKDTKSISFADFVNKELVLFSNADNERSIPSMVDGLKPGQRKVLFTCFKRNDKREIKVAQLAGSVAEHSAYHHGEVSLMTTIINLAQNFVGSNNINLLLPNGQFGTRLQGGKDAASPRYIFTMLNPVTRAMFHPHDEPLLTQQTEDNQKIEPMWYLPIIPMVLVNGADGIGTGWMTKIPNYNPREIVENLKLMIRGEEPTSMKPWYKNFRGSVESVGHQRYVILGEINIIDDVTLEISELPVGTWTQNYKESVLEVMLHGGEKTPATIQDFKEYNTDTTVRFVITVTHAQMEKFEHEGFHKAFKLTSTITNTSMMAFDELGAMTKFEHVNDILHKFYDLRLIYYSKRKDYLLGMLGAEARKLSNQARFIVEKCDNTLIVENKKRRVMIEEMVTRKYDSDPVKAWKKDQDKDFVDDDAEEGEDKDEGGPDFDYLLGMKMWSLTLERKQELLKQRDIKLQEVKDLEKKTPCDLWNNDLDNLLSVLEAQELKEHEDENEGKKGGKVKGPGAKRTVLAKETMPSPHGQRVQPVVDPELLKKIEKAVQAKENKGKRGKKKDEVEVEDEMDAMLANLKPLEERLKNSPELIDKRLQAKRKELKQTKLAFPKATKTKKNKEFDSSHSEESDGSVSDVSFSGEAAPAAPRAAPRRAAAAKAKFNFDSDEELDTDTEARPNGNHDSPDVFKDTAPKRARAFSSSDSDSDAQPQKKKPTTTAQQLESSDTLFDKLVSANTSDAIDLSPEKSSPSPPPKKAPVAKPAAAPKPKKPILIDSDSDDDDYGSGRKNTSDDIFADSSPEKRGASPASSDASFPSPVAKKATAKPAAKPRAKPAASKPKAKPKKKAMSGSESDEDMFESKKKKGGGGSKKKARVSSGSELSDMDVAPRERTNARARKPVSYKLDDGSENSDSEF